MKNELSLNKQFITGFFEELFKTQKFNCGYSTDLFGAYIAGGEL